MNEGVRSIEECSEPNSIRFFLQNFSNLVSSSELGNFLHPPESHRLVYGETIFDERWTLVGPLSAASEPQTYQCPSQTSAVDTCAFILHGTENVKIKLSSAGSVLKVPMTCPVSVERKEKISSSKGLSCLPKEAGWREAVRGSQRMMGGEVWRQEPGPHYFY